MSLFHGDGCVMLRCDRALKVPVHGVCYSLHVTPLATALVHRVENREEH